MRVVGRVSVKVWPDTREFRKRAKAQLEKATKGLKVEVPLEIDDDQAENELRRATLKLKKIAASNPIKVPLTIDMDGSRKQLRAALQTLKRVARLNPIKVKLDVEADRVNLPEGRDIFINVIPRVVGNSAARARQELSDSLGDLPVNIGWSPSEISELRRKLRDSFRDWSVDVGLDVAAQDLRDVRDHFRDLMRDVRVQAQIEWDDSSLGQLQKRLKEKFETTIKPVMDNTAVQLARAELRRVFAETKTKIKMALDRDNLARVKAQLAASFRSATVKIKAVLDKKSVAAVGTALAALTGARLVKEIYRIDLLKNFDKMLPAISLISTAVGALSALLIASAGDVLVLGRHLAQIIPIGLALPGLLTGFVVGAAGVYRALKDFNKELPQVAKGFEQIGNSISRKFWAQAQKPMSELADAWLPKIRRGMDQVATSQGKWLGSFAKELNTSVTPALDGWFQSLSTSTDIMRGMTGPLAVITRSFGDIGAVYLPRFSTWLTKITTDFSVWLSDAENSGAAYEWIETGIVRLKEFWRVITGTFRVLSTLSRAAEEAGGASMKGLGDGLHAWADGLNENFDRVVSVFRAANTAMSELAREAGPGMKALFSGIGQSIEQTLPLIGRVAGLFLGSFATILAQPMVGQGIMDFFTGLEEALRTLQPALPDIGDGLGMLLTLGGTMLKSFAPTLGLAFQGAGNAATGLLAALNDIVPPLSTGLFDALSAVMPAFRSLTTSASEFIRVVGTSLGEALSTVAPHLGTLADGVGVLAGAFLNAFGPVIASAIEQLAPIIGLVASALGQMAEAAAPVVTKIGELVGQFVDWLMPIIQNVAENFLPKLSDAWGRLMESLGPVLDGVQMLGEFLGPILGPIIEFIMGLIGDAFVGVLEGLANTFAGVTGIITGIVNVFKAVMEGDWGALGSALKQIWDGIWQTILGVIQIVLNIGILGIVKKGWTALTGLFTKGGEGIKKNWDKVWNKIKEFASNIWDTIKGVVGRKADDMAKSVKDGLGKLKGFADDAWNKFKGAVDDGISKAVTAVKALPGKITSALGNLGNLLVSSGKSMLDGLARGIREGATKAVNAAKGALDRVRNLFPFSPAKEGPFSGKGWTLYSGRSISESIAEGISDRVGAARRAALELASATRGPLEGSDLALGNQRRIAQAHDTGVGDGGNTYVFNLEVDLDDLDEVNDLVELAKTLRRKARAKGGKR